jgi:hypothetical protein
MFLPKVKKQIQLFTVGYGTGHTATKNSTEITHKRLLTEERTFRCASRTREKHYKNKRQIKRKEKCPIISREKPGKGKRKEIYGALHDDA